MGIDSSLLNTGYAMWIMLVLVAIGTALLTRRFLMVPAREILIAIARALVQMVVVALLISQVSRSWPLTLAFLLLMIAVATHAATKRIGRLKWWVPGAALLSGVAPIVALMFGFGVLPFSSLAVIAVIGQLIGGAMSATNLAGRRMHQELELRGGEVEAALALGFTKREARNLVARPVAAEALLPGMDQTRTVGTVTLPGAFVGLVLGGASPLDAGLVQLVVLLNLMAVQAISVTVMAELIDLEAGVAKESTKSKSSARKTVNS